MQEQVAQQLIGRIRKTVPQASYGFISTDDGQEIFFHLNNLRDRKKDTKLPKVGAVVTFRLVHQTAAGKKDRAVDVEVL